VDDSLLVGSKESLLNVMSEMPKLGKVEFGELDAGECTHLGMKIRRAVDATGKFELWVSQPITLMKLFEAEEKWMKKARTGGAGGIRVDKDGVLEDATDFRSVLMTAAYVQRTRPDIREMVAKLTPKMQSPTEVDATRLRSLVKYLRETEDFEMRIATVDSLEVRVSADASFATGTKGRSISGLHLSLGTNGATMYARSTTQGSVAMSTCEAEIGAISLAAQEALWVAKMMRGQGEAVPRVVIENDNTSAIHLLKTGPTGKGRTKWLDVKTFWVHAKLEDQELELEYTKSEELVADGFTKGLGGEAFRKWRTRVLNWKA